MLKTKKSNPNKPPVVLIHGPEGVGKSTLGARADKPVFLAIENGCDQLKNKEGGPVDILEDTNTWEGALRGVESLTNDKHDFQTLCVDSADWIERLAHKKILGGSGRSITTVNGGYGAGFNESENLHRIFIEKLTALRDKRNMGIIITAHSHVREVKDPHSPENYDRFEIKCHEKVSALWREWAYAVLFVNFNTYVKANEDEKKKSRAFTDNQRSMYTMNDPAYMAKNRYGMPKQLDFGFDAWEVIKGYAIQNSPKQVQTMIIKMLAQVADSEKKNKILNYVQSVDDNLYLLTEAQNRVNEIINEQGGNNVTN